MTNLDLEHLSKRIEILEKKLSREKKARGLAEKQLEEYSLEIYNTNQSLQKSLLFSEKKQAELAFLGNAAAKVSSDHSMEELLTATTSMTGKFIGANWGCHFTCAKGVLEKGKVNFWHGETCQFEDRVAFGFLSTSFPLGDSDALDTWIIQSLEESSEVEGNWLLATNFVLLNDRVTWLLFVCDSEFIDEESIFVLDTARGHLLSGLRRRLNDVRILKRTVELQETVKNLEKTKRQLLQSEKMASLGQLAAGVAHEINNPVGFISSNMEVLRDYMSDFDAVFESIKKDFCHGNDSSAQALTKLIDDADIGYLLTDTKELLQANLEGLTRVKDIVNGLKTFSHGGDGKLTLMSIVGCVDSALKVAWNQLKYDYQVENAVTEPLPQIKGNTGQLQQVFVNLFVNAAQAMETGGKLTVTAFSDAQYLTVKVADTGCGMDEKTRNQLFTPFFTTKAVGEGTGLGLSVSYSILESHNVKVEVDSTPGKGTTFTLGFPL